MRIHTTAVVLAVIGLVAACGGSSGESTPTTATATPTAVSPAAAGTTPAPAATSTATPTATATATATAEVATPTPTVAAATPTVAAATPTPTAPPAATPAATSTPPPATPPPSPAGGAVTITVRARNIAFDRSTITVAAGSTVTLVFINEDQGVDHNLALDIPGTAKDTCLGPCQTTQTFAAPAPGSYFFFCTIHAAMFGTFVVQ